MFIIFSVVFSYSSPTQWQATKAKKLYKQSEDQNQKNIWILRAIPFFYFSRALLNSSSYFFREVMALGPLIVVSSTLVGWRGVVIITIRPDYESALPLAGCWSGHCSRVVLGIKTVPFQPAGILESRSSLASVKWIFIPHFLPTLFCALYMRWMT